MCVWCSKDNPVLVYMYIYTKTHALPYHPHTNAHQHTPPSQPHCQHSTLSDDDIRTAIKNSGGVRGSLLLPDAPFELLVRRAIGRLLPPALQCKEFVFAELQRIAHHSIPPDVQRFPALQVCMCGVWCVCACVCACVCIEKPHLITTHTLHLITTHPISQ